MEPQEFVPPGVTKTGYMVERYYFTEKCAYKLPRSSEVPNGRTSMLNFSLTPSKDLNTHKDSMENLLIVKSLLAAFYPNKL